MAWEGKQVDDDRLWMPIAACTCDPTSTDCPEEDGMESALQDFRNSCATPLSFLREIAQAMATAMHAGLAFPGTSALKMLPTFVYKLPAGNERGLYYAVDLGGTNFRVLRIQVGGREGRILKQEQKAVPIPRELMVGSSKDLFDFIAAAIIDFVSQEGKGFKCLALNQQRDIGFTFSFPIHQTSINEGEIVQWTKGFNIPDAVGQDVVGQLQAALGKKGSDMKVICLVNDTVGTLAQCRYYNEDAMVGVILGTGSNACYVEHANAVPTSNGSRPIFGETVINTEWGNFHSSALPRTFADEGLDDDSLNPGQQHFEKMMSGMYMGEIVRRVLLKMAQTTDLFRTEVPPKLTQSFSITTPDMSRMHGDNTGDLRVVARVLKDVIGVIDTNLATRRTVYNVCDIVAERGARLAAAGIVGILTKIGRIGETAKRTTVAVDGSLYEHYDMFRGYLEKALKEQLGDETACHMATKVSQGLGGLANHVTIELSKDGSGVGAALLAAALSTHGSGIFDVNCACVDED